MAKGKDSAWARYLAAGQLVIIDTASCVRLFTAHYNRRATILQGIIITRRLYFPSKTVRVPSAARYFLSQWSGIHMTSARARFLEASTALATPAWRHLYNLLSNLDVKNSLMFFIHGTLSSSRFDVFLFLQRLLFSKTEKNCIHVL